MDEPQKPGSRTVFPGVRPEDAGVPRVRAFQVLRGNVMMMGLVSLFTDLSSEMINPLLPIFIAGLVPASTTALVVGLMEGIAETAASLLKIVSGRLSDRLGKRKAMVLGGYGLSAAARPLLALAPAAPAGAGAAFVVGLKLLDRVGKGVRTSPRDALIGDSVHASHRGLAFSFHRAMDHLGAVAGPLTAIAVLQVMLGYALWRSSQGAVSPAEMHALRWLFGLALFPGLVAVGVLAFGVREIAPQPSPRGEGAGKAAMAALPRPFLAYVGIVTLFALGNSSDMFLVLYGWQKFGLGLLQLAGLWIALHVSKMVFSVPGGVLSDRFGRRPLIVGGWAVYALVYLGLGLAQTAGQFWALIAAYGLYFGLTEGAEKALVADFVPSPQRGTAFGLFHGAVGLAALPASLLFGVFWAALGPQRAFTIGAVLAGLAVTLMLVLLARTRPTES